MPWLRSAAFAVVITMLAAGAGLAQHLQPYAGQQDRAIAGLSADEVKAFLDGRGMGLAKPAEVNGYPGPMHVLELADEVEADGRAAAASATGLRAHEGAGGGAWRALCGGRKGAR
jgi:hypothetical protein